MKGGFYYDIRRIQENQRIQESKNTTVCVNGEDAISEIYYPDELDFLPVVGVGYDTEGITIDLVCTNWDKRFDIGWIGE